MSGTKTFLQSWTDSFSHHYITTTILTPTYRLFVEIMSPPKFLKPKAVHNQLRTRPTRRVNSHHWRSHPSPQWLFLSPCGQKGPPVHVANPPRCSSTSCRSWCKPFNKILHVLKWPRISKLSKRNFQLNQYFWPSLIQVHRHRSWIVHRRLIRASIVNHTVLPADSTGEGWGLTQGLWDNETLWKSW